MWLLGTFKIYELLISYSDSSCSWLWGRIENRFKRDTATPLDINNSEVARSTVARFIFRLPNDCRLLRTADT